MRSDFDWQRLDDIPDPFTGSAEAPPPRPVVLTRSPARAETGRLRIAALAAAIGYEVVVVFALGIRPDLPSLPAWKIALSLLIPATVAAFAFAAAVREGDRGLGESPLRLRTWTLGAPILFALGTWLTFPHGRDGALWQPAFSCFVTTGLLGVGPVFFAAWSMRRSFVAAAGWRAAALGLACAALAATALSLVCANGNASHVLLGHGPMMLVLGLLGALVGRGIARA